jgi:hypothetical protein
VSAESTSEEEEGNLEHHWKALNEGVEWPFLEPIAFALAVSATLDHRPARVPQVPVEPLFSQHRDECGEQEIRRLAYMSSVTVTISLGGSS